MAVHTHTPRVLKARRAIMELLIASHPQDCLSCVRGGDCELATLAARRRRPPARYVGAVKQHPVDISSPALWRDPNKCVLCGRCVTACHDVQGVGAIDFTGRGFKTRVAPGFAVGLNVSECVYCGQCARVCPTGAIVERDQVDEVVSGAGRPRRRGGRAGRPGRAGHPARGPQQERGRPRDARAAGGGAQARRLRRRVRHELRRRPDDHGGGAPSCSTASRTAACCRCSPAAPPPG